MARIMIFLKDDEVSALRALSETQRRHPREQAAILIRESLEELGMLTRDELFENERRNDDNSNSTIQNSQ